MLRLRRPKITKEGFKLPFSYEETFQLLLCAIEGEVFKRRMQFKVTDSLKKQISLVADCLTKESNKFGLILYGLCGNGKTTLIKAIQQLMIQLRIKDDYGREILMELMDARTLTETCKRKPKKWEDLCYREMLAIDDVGIEQVEVIDYGNVLSPLIDLIMKRYDRRLFTIISTNLKPEEIRTRYTDRIADRLNEMMVKIIYENDTFRI